MQGPLSGLVMILSAALAGDPERPQEAFFDSGGVKIRYCVQGQGAPVVLIHGFSANSAIQWGLPGITTALAKSYKVIEIDNRGHGRSGKPHETEQYGVEMARDIVRLLDHLQIAKAHLVGYSMGGFITAKVMIMNPERVQSATIAGAGWSQKVDVKFLDELADSIDQGQGISLLIRRLTPANKPKPSEDQLKGINQMFKLVNDTKAMAAAMRGMKNLQVSEDELKACKAPTLALIGELDPLKESADGLIGRVPNLRTVVIAGADHMDAFAKPAFLKALAIFLEENTPSDLRKKAVVPSGAEGGK